MTDGKIIEDRQDKYGPPVEFFEAHARLCSIVDEYQSLNENKHKNDPHTKVLEMVLLKVLRSAWNPSVEDNYCDARNYLTIAEMFKNYGVPVSMWKGESL